MASLFEDFSTQFFIFYNVVQAMAGDKSFKRAAERCFLDKSEVSKAISKLERELGTELFEKKSSKKSGGRPMRTPNITDAGKALFDGIDCPIQEIIRVCEDLSPARAVVRVAAHQAVVEHEILPRIADAGVTPPDFRLVTRHRPTSRILELVRRHEVHFGIVSGNSRAFAHAVREKWDDSPKNLGLGYKLYKRFPTVLFLPPDPEQLGIRFRCRRPTIREIAKGPLALVNSYAAFRHHVDEQLRKHTPNIRFELDSGSSVIAAVNSGLAMAIVHEVTVPHAMREDNERVIPLSPHIFRETRLGIVYATDHTLPDAVKDLIDLLCDAAELTKRPR